MKTALIRELNNNDCDGLRKRYLKVKSRCFKLFRTFSISYRSSNVGIFFVELNSKGLLGVQEKKKKVVVSSSTKREIRHFHVVVLQWRQRRVQNEFCMCRVTVLPFSLACSSGVFWAGQTVVNMALSWAKHSRARRKRLHCRLRSRWCYRPRCWSSLITIKWSRQLF